MILFDFLWFYLIFFDFLWFSLIFFDFLWCSLMFFNFVWFSMIFYDFLWFVLIFFDFLWFSLIFEIFSLSLSLSLNYHFPVRPFTRNLEKHSSVRKLCFFNLRVKSLAGKRSLPEVKGAIPSEKRTGITALTSRSNHFPVTPFTRNLKKHSSVRKLCFFYLRVKSLAGKRSLPEVKGAIPSEKRTGITALTSGSYHFPVRPFTFD